LIIYKRIASTPGAIQKEFSPTSIVAVTNVTGLVTETYRIRKVLYATSYNWALTRNTNAIITHLNPPGENDTAVLVTFASCFSRDTLTVRAATACSISSSRIAVLYAYNTPASVLSITTVGGNFTTCIGSTKIFTAVRGTPNNVQAPIASFRWTKPSNTTIISATADSSSITLGFNLGYNGGNISAKGVSACGIVGATATTATLQFLPPAVLSIASSNGSYNACIGDVISYSALVSAPTINQTTASVFRWTKPINTSIISATADSSTIDLQFLTGYVGGALAVRGQSSCGTLGTSKTQNLTHVGCAPGTKLTETLFTKNKEDVYEVQLYPNPTIGAFNLKIQSPTNKRKAIVKVIDLQGRLLKSFECHANQVISIGNDLHSGVYMIEVRMGDSSKVVRAVKF
jgi:hypothetical protein